MSVVQKTRFALFGLFLFLFRSAASSYVPTLLFLFGAAASEGTPSVCQKAQRQTGSLRSSDRPPKSCTADLSTKWLTTFPRDSHSPCHIPYCVPFALGPFNPASALHRLSFFSSLSASPPPPGAWAGDWQNPPKYQSYLYTYIQKGSKNISKHIGIIGIIGMLARFRNLRPPPGPGGGGG